MALMMSLVMSFTVTAANISFSSNFVTTWIEGFIVGSLVAISTFLIASPIIQEANKPNFEANVFSMILLKIQFQASMYPL